MNILSGTFQSDGKDQRCIFKVASNEDQQKKLEREKNNLQLIIDRDLQLKRQRFLAMWFHSSLLESDQIHFLTDTGDYHPLPLPMMRGLVFECGGPNLKDYLKNQSHLSVPVTQRVQILNEIIEAIDFLHKIKIVHFDLKPENIVSFSTDQKTRWKLIDFDSCHDEGSHPSLLSFLSTNNSDLNLWFTQSYAAPEIMNALLPSGVISDIAINWRMDIWSLGLITFFLFSDHSFWSQYSSSQSFKSSLVTSLCQDEIQFILLKLSRFFGLKEKSILESCLQINPLLRLPTNELLKKSLFDTCESTIHAANTFNGRRDDTGSLLSKIEEIHTTLKECPDRAHQLVSEEMNNRFEEFYFCITAQIDRQQNERLTD
jgi:serine/threonine protein kinase